MENSLTKGFKLEPKLCKTAFLWGVVLLVVFVLLRGQPTEDIYHLFVNISDFVTSSISFIEASLDIAGYVLLLLLLAALAYALGSVYRAWGQRRRQQRSFC